MSYWRDKRALVTGGSAGLGLHLSRELATAGAKVAIVGRSQARLDDAADMLRGIGGDILTLSADVAQPGQTAWAVEQAVEAFGELHFACACAGRSMRGTIVDTPRQTFEEMLAVNFLAALDLAQAAGPHLETAFSDEQGSESYGGHLVLIGSLASKTALKYLGAYPASKFPLAALAQQLRLERPELHTLLVCPGPIARDDNGERYREQSADLPEEARQPAGGAKVRAIEPADLARRILRACESRKSELVVPLKARLLFAISQLSPALGDWLLKKQSGGLRKSWPKKRF